MYEPKLARTSAIVLNELLSLQLVALSPFVDWLILIVYNDFGASFLESLKALSTEKLSFFFSRLPVVTAASISAYLAWVVFQAALYMLVPGPLHQAPRTPGGRCLMYRLNGFRAWIVTIAAAVAACYLDLTDPAMIAENWPTALATAALYASMLIVVFWIKARLSPDDKGDTLITGHFWYDLFNGGELHPRTGKFFDWKHFNASRSGGMIAWTLIDLSFAALQYRRYSTVTRSMILTMVFRVIIVAEYFIYEDLFFETLDGAHERFSFYNIFGFAVMMPHLWTLQTQYLAVHPVVTNNITSILIVALFCTGWTINHVANDQKNACRRAETQIQIRGKQTITIKTRYQTADGKIHQSVLLCSGLWGIVRHPNYIGSIIYTWASCMPCGNQHIMPYTEAILVTGICVHRCFRDEARCLAKHGEAWNEYCRLVRWRIIPGIF